MTLVNDISVCNNSKTFYRLVCARRLRQGVGNASTLDGNGATHFLRVPKLCLGTGLRKLRFPSSEDGFQLSMEPTGGGASGCLGVRWLDTALHCQRERASNVRQALLADDGSEEVLPGMPRADDRGLHRFSAAVPLRMEGGVEPPHSRSLVPMRSMGTRGTLRLLRSRLRTLPPGLRFVLRSSLFLDCTWLSPRLNCKPRGSRGSSPESRAST